MQSNDCNDRCSSLLYARVIGESQPVSIKSNFVPGSRYSFSVDIEFGRAYISKFTLSVGINQNLKRYFNQVNISTENFEINPAYLAKAEEDVLA